MKYKASSVTGKNIACLRSQKNMTQEDLAKKAGISKSSVGNIETGRRDAVSMASLEAIAEALDVNMWELFYEYDNELHRKNAMELIEREQSASKAFYPPTCKWYTITSLMEFLIYAPLINWHLLADVIARIEGDYYNRESYVFNLLSRLTALIKDGPALRHAQHLHEAYNLRRAGANIDENFNFLNAIKDDEYDAYKQACWDKIKEQAHKVREDHE